MNRKMHHKVLLSAVCVLFLVSTAISNRHTLAEENNTQLNNNTPAADKPFPSSQRLYYLRHKVIIIIDDVGLDMTHFTELMNLPEKLTVSILPGEKYSVICAEIANQKGFEVILHQPMQPRDSKENHIGSGGIFISMKPETVEKILIENLCNFPHIKGVNNHMGSFATTRAELMRVVMKVLKEKKMYFVDSITTGSSKAYKTAIDAGVNALKRDIFIDTNDGYEYAVKQLQLLRKLARRKTISVAIGHCKPATIKALKNILPEFEKDGIEVVSASEVFVK
jgi:polysaccharide deacetylase 2 family uncharacterized protein YibQ